MGESSYRKGYKSCIVPDCDNTSLKSPNKIFVTLPQNPKRNKQWQLAMGRTKMLSVKSVYFVCEDHFNLETDMENYVEFTLMGNVKMRMKPEVVPHIFDCQGSHISTQSHQVELPNTIETLESCSEVRQRNIKVQANIKPRIVSRATQCNLIKHLNKRVENKPSCSVSSSSSNSMK